MEIVMENPFNLSNEKLKILLDAYANWYKTNQLTVDWGRTKATD